MGSRETLAMAIIIAIMTMLMLMLMVMLLLLAIHKPIPIPLHGGVLRRLRLLNTSRRLLSLLLGSRLGPRHDAIRSERIVQEQRV